MAITIAPAPRRGWLARLIGAVWPAPAPHKQGEPTLSHQTRRRLLALAIIRTTDQRGFD
jgi:hypothetical protein